MPRSAQVGAFLFVLLSAAAARASDLQAWNTTEITALATNRVGWDVYGVVRTRDHLSSAYDDRFGTLLRVSAARRLWLGTGYLRRYVNPDRLRMRPENRFVAGATLIPTLRPVRLEWVSLYERHFAIRGVRDFNRYKQRLEIERMRRGPAPFLSEEFTFRREGFVRTRAFAGLRWRFPSGARFEVGYQFESLKVGGAWLPRHAVRSTLNLGVLFDRRRRG